MNMELVFLGTGNAMVTRCYNTCFAFRQGEACFLVDAGGGNGIKPIPIKKRTISVFHPFNASSNSSSLKGTCTGVVRTISANCCFLRWIASIFSSSVPAVTKR